MDERQIRAAAIQAAAALCAPVGNVSEAVVPDVENVLFVADVFAGYIEGGWQAALQVHSTGTQTVPVVQQIDHPDIPEAAEQAPGESGEQVVQQAEDVDVPEPETAKVVEVKFGSGGKKQSDARSKIERIRRDHANRIMTQAGVAKVRAHKDRLIEEAESSGLNDFPVVVRGKNVTLGSYLASL